MRESHCPRKHARYFLRAHSKHTHYIHIYASAALRDLLLCFKVGRMRVCVYPALVSVLLTPREKRAPDHMPAFAFLISCEFRALIRFSIDLICATAAALTDPLHQKLKNLHAAADITVVCLLVFLPLS
jgi:hypothetical protein